MNDKNRKHAARTQRENNNNAFHQISCAIDKKKYFKVRAQQRVGTHE